MQVVEESREESYEVWRQGAMCERSEDGIGGFWVARIGHADIEWTLTE